ncbi:LacI family DNA-binding transcriptional regulator [Brevibacterium oceani]|uniref:LacI family DNA-binding transcriptional regulator n=1 Tax=Brevibacterium oceani TaxID=358099 RepID=UPI0015E6F198|nr:LacI family DNA-binding transcriptional regulator [Brevibacterium oceani]
MAKVSMREVADRAGVSVGTVSHVVNGSSRVAASTARKVNEAIDELGFVRNAAARQLRSGHSSSLGLVVLDTSNPFFASVAHGARQACDEAGLSLLIGDSGTDEVRESKYVDLFAEQRVNGLLVTPTGSDLSQLESVAGRGTPVMLVDRASRGYALSSVTVDNVAGGRMALDHILAGGCTRPAFIGGPQSLPQVADRLLGARGRAEESGLELPVFGTEELTILAGRNAGEKVVALPDGERPDAVFCANDLLAVGFMQAVLMFSDLRIPDDIAIVGYDDIDYAFSTIVPLTSVRQPAELLGRTAVETLLQENASVSHEHHDREFTPELVVRGSTRPI